MSSRTASRSGLVGKSLSVPFIHPKGGTSSAAWYREPSWLALPDVTGLQRLVGVVAIWPDSNFLAVTCAGSLGYLVDWGDGTSSTVATTVQADKQYDFNSVSLANTNAPCTLTDIGDLVTRTAHGYTSGQTAKFFNILTTTGLTDNYTYFVINATADTFQVALTLGGAAIALTLDGTATLLPYKQAIVSITPQSTGTLTSLNLNVKHAAIGGSILPAYTAGWLDIAIAGTSLATLTIGGVTVYQGDLEQVKIVGGNSITSMATMFSNCYSLQSVPLFSTAGVTNMVSMFLNCYSLQSVPLFNTGAVTSMASMFNACSSLQSVPLFSTAGVTNMASMFNACYSLQSVPLFNTVAVTSMSSIFSSCPLLQSVPLFNTAAVTSMSSMFSSCSSLQSVPLFNTAGVTNMVSMFINCYSLQSVPLFNTGAVTSMASMFNACSSLQSVPLFNTAAVTSMTSMFANCPSLQSVPLFNTAVVTNMSNMFNACFSLQSVPLFNTGAVTTMSTMFSGGCFSLQSVPLFNTVAVTDMTSMFSNCSSLQSVPLFNTAAVTSMSTMFNSCPSLQSVPLFNTAAVTSMTNMFNTCRSLQSVPLFNAGLIGFATGMFSNSTQLAVGRLNNLKVAISYAGCKLSKTALEDIFNGLGKASGAQTFTIGTNWGAAPVVSLSGTTTEGSLTVTMASTTGIAVGMQVTGTNSPLTKDGAVSLQDAGDTVTRASHLLLNGTEVSFATIVNTTGIATFTPYFVINATVNTFQVALTAGGAAIALTLDGTGSILYRTVVEAINPNVSVTLSRPATASGLTTLTYRQLTTGTAILKGWTVSG